MLYPTLEITRMTTLIKAKLKKSDDKTNIDKYRVATNITILTFLHTLFT